MMPIICAIKIKEPKVFANLHRELDQQDMDIVSHTNVQRALPPKSCTRVTLHE